MEAGVVAAAVSGTAIVTAPGLPDSAYAATMLPDTLDSDDDNRTLSGSALLRLCGGENAVASETIRADSVTAQPAKAATATHRLH